MPKKVGPSPAQPPRSAFADNANVTSPETTTLVDEVDSLNSPPAELAGSQLSNLQLRTPNLNEAQKLSPALSIPSPGLPCLEYPGIQSICERYTDRYGLPIEEVFWLASHLIARDPRFQNVIVDLPPEVPAPQTDRQKHLLEHSKLCNRLTQDLVGLLKRPIDQLSIGERHYVQRCGHLNTELSGQMELTQDLTLSSDAIKRDYKRGNEHMLFFNANLASIESSNRVLCTRSARTDTPRKLEELLAFNALTSLKAANGDITLANGFQHDSEIGEYEFQLALTTAMDLSLLKSLATRVAPKGENERKLIEHIEGAVSDLFGDNQRITRSLNVDGRAVDIHFARPLLLNTTISGQSSLAHNIEGHRQFNRPAIMELVKILCIEWIQKDDPRQLLAHELTQGLIQGKTGLSNRNFWRQPVVMEARHNLSSKERLVLDFLQLAFSGQDANDNSLLSATDPGVEFILLTYLLDSTNVALSVQCKSGEDRTLTLASLKFAATAFEEESLHSFDPLLPPDHEDVKRFRVLFTDAANHFGKNMIKLVRGYNSRKGIAKWASHNVPRRWYNVDQDPSHPIGDFGRIWKQRG